ncbi:MAG: flippase [Bacteroidota bacterium]
MLENNKSVTQARAGNGLRARNILLNIMGQIIPIIVGIIAIPFIVQGLGIEGFGILSLAWMVLGYFAIFDLGLGRATTKFISEELKNGITINLRSLFWTSCWMNLVLGFVGGILIASMASFLAESVFRISPGMIQEARTIFFILAVSCPIVLVSTAFRGTLEAAQQFKYVNIVIAIFSSLSFLLPVFGIIVGFDIQGIIILLMISRLCGALVYLLLCFRVFPILRMNVSFGFNRVRQLLKFGGWVSISNFVSPILFYLDRFLIGSLISVAAVAYYTAPYEMVMRLSILPVSFAMTLFPSFSAVAAAVRESQTGLYSHSVKMLLVVIGPLVATVVLFAVDILRLWLGLQFAENSMLILQILAIGMLVNSLAQIPFALIQGFGRPDITAKFHFIELLLYAPLTWFLVKNMGIVGGAIAWTIRVTFDAMLLFSVSIKFINFQKFFDIRLKRCIIFVFSLLCILIGLSFLNGTFIIKMVISTPIIALYAIASWYFVLDVGEREMISSLARRFVGVTGETI